jgi:subtilase family serine protease
MALSKKQVISAQVVLRSASGKAFDGHTPITSETIDEFRPSTETVEETTSAFTSAGFDIGAMVGISFSITGSVVTFEKVFETKLTYHNKKGIQAMLTDGSFSSELPLTEIAESIASLIVTVTFMPPPDFGPNEFFAI